MPRGLRWHTISTPNRGKFRKQTPTPRRSTRKSKARPTTGRPKYITVAVRIRPPSQEEIKQQEPLLWEYDLDEQTINEKPMTEMVTCDGEIIPPSPSIITRNKFDYICPANQGTLQVYNQTCKVVVDGCCKGINGTIFAYGQTASGKTYTMLGTETKPGILILALSDVFHYIRTCETREFQLRVSYLEIHNEVVNDLLEPDRQNLKVVSVNSDFKAGPVIRGLTEVAIKTPHDLIRILLKGEDHRKVAQTTSNDRSSRSHTIFQLHIQSKLKENGKNKKILASTFACVDLAGSESVSQVVSRQQKRECRHINRSLLGLGRVIMTLSKFGSTQGGSHIPYRDSKLTRILQPALGGNATCTIICTISPTRMCREETLHTLHFARTAKMCKNHIAVNERLDDKELLKKYQNLVKLLKQKIKVYIAKAQEAQKTQKAMSKLRKINSDMAVEIKDLRAQLSRAHTRTVTPSQTPIPMFSPGLETPQIKLLPNLPQTTVPNLNLEQAVKSKLELEGVPDDSVLFEMPDPRPLQQKLELTQNADDTLSAASGLTGHSVHSLTSSNTSYVNQAISQLQNKLTEVEANMQHLANRVEMSHAPVDPQSIAGFGKPEGKSLVYNGHTPRSSSIAPFAVSPPYTNNVGPDEDIHPSVPVVNIDMAIGEITVDRDGTPVVDVDLGDSNEKLPELQGKDVALLPPHAPLVTSNPEQYSVEIEPDEPEEAEPAAQELNQLVALQSQFARRESNKLEDMKESKQVPDYISAYLKKFTTRGSNHFRLVTVETSKNTIRIGSKTFLLSGIVGIQTGIPHDRATQIGHKNFAPEKSFTIAIKERTLEFMTASEVQRDYWVESLRLIVNKKYLELR